MERENNYAPGNETYDEETDRGMSQIVLTQYNNINSICIIIFNNGQRSP